VTPTDVVVTAPARDVHAGSTATVHLCEFKHGNLFRRVQLPRTVNPAGARANLNSSLAKTAGSPRRSMPNCCLRCRWRSAGRRRAGALASTSPA
jgi:hypothetical protein